MSPSTRAAEHKGHDILIAALGQLRDLDWQAEIVGKTHDPAVEARRRAQITVLRLEVRIRLAGLLPDSAVIDRYRSATICAPATRYGGYSIVLGEAMLHGLPIVSCHTDAVPTPFRRARAFWCPSMTSTTSPRHSGLC